MQKGREVRGSLSCPTLFTLASTQGRVRFTQNETDMKRGRGALLSLHFKQFAAKRKNSLSQHLIYRHAPTCCKSTFTICIDEVLPGGDLPQCYCPGLSPSPAPLLGPLRMCLPYLTTTTGTLGPSCPGKGKRPVAVASPTRLSALPVRTPYLRVSRQSTRICSRDSGWSESSKLKPSMPSSNWCG